VSFFANALFGSITLQKGVISSKRIPLRVTEKEVVVDLSFYKTAFSEKE
jgi:hypothetical protein